MTSISRPMSIGEVLDRAIQLFSSKFAMFAGIAVFPALVSFLNVLITPARSTLGTGDVGAGCLYAFPPSLGLQIVLLILTSLSTAAICFATSRLYLDEPVTLRSAYSPFTTRKATLVGITLLQALFAFWPLFVAAILASIFMVVATIGSGTDIGSPGWWVRYVAFISPGIIASLALYPRYALAFPAAAIENRTAMDSINRSVELGRGFRWKICWAFLLPVFLGMLAAGGSLALTSWLNSPTSPLAGSPFVVKIIQGLTSVAVQVCFAPFGAIVLTVLYYDIRVRKEGFDIARMLEQANPSLYPPPVEQPAGPDPFQDVSMQWRYASPQQAPEHPTAAATPEPPAAPDVPPTATPEEPS